MRKYLILMFILIEIALSNDLLNNNANIENEMNIISPKINELYYKKTFIHGYKDKKFPNNTYSIEFDSRYDVITKPIINDFIMLRSAEITLKNNFNSFKIIERKGKKYVDDDIDLKFKIKLNNVETISENNSFVASEVKSIVCEQYNIKGICDE